MVSRRATSDDGHSSPQDVLLFFFLSLIIGCACRFVLDIIKKRLGLRIPYSVVLLIIGGGLGAAAWKNTNEADGSSSELTTVSLNAWAEIDPHLILFLFLPALLFECAMGTNFYIFSKHLFSAVLFAGPGVIVQTFLVALVAKYVLPYEWGWTESMLFGGICSATDPVAVIALLKELGTLPDLRVLIEAESLLNDGAAIVVYQLCLKILTSPESTEEYVASGFRMTLGAPALGTAVYLVSVFWMNNTIDPIQDTMVSLLSAYVAFWVAELPAVGMSGVLTVVTVGILFAGYGNTAISTEEGEHVQHAVWSLLCFCADTIIFVLSGAIIMKTTFLENSGLMTGSDWGYLLALYLLLTLIRGFMVLLCSPFLRFFGYGLQPRNCSWMVFTKNMLVVTWGGLRGAVGLVLALSVSVDSKVRDAVDDKFYNERVLMLTAGMVVLTTLVNAATLEKVIDMLGMLAATDTNKSLFKKALDFLEVQHEHAVTHLQNRDTHPELTCVDWEALDKCVGQDAIFEHHRVEPAEEPFSVTSEPEQGALRRAGSLREVAEVEETEKEMLLRFLVSLRSSYSSQWLAGLLATAPLRNLLWALDRAVDHANGPDAAIVGKVDNPGVMRFDWGWLHVEGQLELPWYVRQLRQAPVGVLQWLGGQLEVACTRRHVEMACATIKAHEEASQVELHSGHTCFDALMRDSALVRHEAQNALEALARAHPEVVAAVRTRQACCLILGTVQEEVEALHRTAQITDGEHEHLKTTVEDKLDFFHSNYPAINPAEATPASLPVLRLLPPDAIGSVWSELDLQPVSFAEGAEICGPGSKSEGVYVVLSGTVAWTPGLDAPEWGRTLAQKTKQSDLLVSADIGFADGESHVKEIRELQHSGMSFGEESLLLKVGGFEGQHVGRAVATTAVELYLLPMERMEELVGRFPRVLEHLWGQHGASLLRRFPHCFHSAEEGHSYFGDAFHPLLCALSQRVHIHYPLLLIQGRARLADGSDVRPFTFITRHVSATLEPSPETCACYLSFRPDQSSVGLRNQHMGHRRGSAILEDAAFDVNVFIPQSSAGVEGV